VREINSILTAAGMPRHSIAVRPYHVADPAQSATVRLNYSRIVAEAGPCGLWPEDLGPSFNPTYGENVPYWNLGCANQRNLAAMVANPADLVQPRAETPEWTARRTTVLERYRAGQPTGTQYQNTQKGQLSDIGR
jgi:pilus assembly protein CpaD